ncbi:MAG: ATP-dependent Clp protease adaptor protein ClpS [Chloroflexota bacterium]|nr:ATP-dependent Clp protease adaptor protein ClpS [Chloroflexota bacterium]
MRIEPRPALRVASPGTITTPRIDAENETRSVTLPPWVVILYNDDVNSMDHVVASLLKSIPTLKAQQAVLIMYEAHNHGRALVVTCPLELAELYRDRLQTFGLTASIEQG